MDTFKLVPTLKHKDELYNGGYGKKLLEYWLTIEKGEQFRWAVLSGQDNVVILPITKDNKIVCLRQYRVAAEDIIWELPNGTIKNNAEQTAAQELLEETGYSGDIHLLPETHYFEPSSLTAKFYVALAKNCVYKQPPQYDKYEFAETCVLDWNTWLELVLNGEVKDSKSIVATLKLRNTIK